MSVFSHKWYIGTNSRLNSDHEYPMHPIDAIEFGYDDDLNVTCTGAFSYVAEDAGVGERFFSNYIHCLDLTYT